VRAPFLSCPRDGLAEAAEDGAYFASDELVRHAVHGPADAPWRIVAVA